MQKTTYYKKNNRSSAKQHGFRRKPVLRWVLIAVGIGLFFAFFTGPKSLFKLYSLYQERETLTREEMQLQEETKKLDDEIHKLQTDEKYIEKMAREKNKMKKKGEQVYEVDPQ